MRDPLLDYYERELTYLRRAGAEFAERYPGAASRLMLAPTRCDDPHVERLLEGFAFLAARVHMRLDDDTPEIAEALLEAAYPQYVRPIPSMSLVQMHPDPERVIAGGHHVPQGTLLYSRDVGGASCKFRTCHDTTLWPVSVAAARWMTPHEVRPPVEAAGAATAALRVELRCGGGATFAALGADSLRFHISAEPGVAGSLYELLCNSCERVVVRDLTLGSRAEPVVLAGTAVEAAGFGADEAMLPTARGAFHGYRLLQEYFTVPEKFSFVDLHGLDRVRASGMGSAVEVIFLVSRFERAERHHALGAAVSAETLRLGCVPVVNLFPRMSEPTSLTQRASEYRVRADAHRPSTGIYSVEAVAAVAPGSAAPVRLAPLHAARDGEGAATADVFWHARRRPSGLRPEGAADVYLQFVDREARLAHPDVNTVTASLLCHNGDLPARLEAGGDLFLPGGGPVARVVILVKPTPPVHPPAGGARLWRLVSQLSLNYASLVDGGAPALHSLLRLHNFAGLHSAEKQIAGIGEVRGTAVHARVGGESGVAFARGHRVEVTFDEEQFAGGGVYLMASVLERFLGMYVSINSFSVLAARTRQRREPLREWAPRAGWKPLL